MLLILHNLQLKLNSINTLKEGIHELWMKINAENFHTVKWGNFE